jgi:hypothetical protein
MSDPLTRPAFYAGRRSAAGDWWSVLHPPYTAWHLSYVVFGAVLAPSTDGGRLAASLVAFFAAVGVAAHTLDELHDRPLHTGIGDRLLVVASVGGLAIAVAIGIAGVLTATVVLVPFIVIGPVLVAAYNLEWFGGRLHTDLGFALAWGAFPLLVGYIAQSGTLGVPAVIGSIAAAALAFGQRALSTPARMLRRRVARADGTLVLHDGSVRAVDVGTMLVPIERALRAFAYGLTALAIALAYARLS